MSYQNGRSTTNNGNGTVQAQERGKTPKSWLLGLVVAVICAAVAYWRMHAPSAAASNISQSIAKSGKVQVNADTGKMQLFDDLNRYVLEDYDTKSTFASFLPGVAGYFGKPVWAFYVNRGQAISTFGTASKDFPMLEFNAANKAYQSTAFLGFRTFVHGYRGSQSFAVEPFSLERTRTGDNDDDENLPKRILFVGTNEVEIQEIDGLHEMTTTVSYFVLPEETFGALVRRTTIANDGSTPLQLDILDGLAKMEPFGGALDGMLKSMGRTLEGWMGVYHADDTLTMPFYKLSTEPSDAANVVIEQGGHYCLSLIESDSTQLLPIVYDTTKIFGTETSLASATAWTSVGDLVGNPQYGWAKTSSAFGAVDSITLEPGANITIASFYGKADHIDFLDHIKETITQPGYVAQKHERAREILDELTAGVETTTANPLFDGTVAQMFLDNSLRGGVPTILGKVEGDATYDEDEEVKVFHAFSRIHGDLERDYNAFLIDPTYFSQGPGNYRDVAQNRRNDVTFFPRMGSFDIQMFLSFIQADGYEPLTVEAVVYRFTDAEEAAALAKKLTADDKSAKSFADVLINGAVRPGQIFTLCDQLNINRDLAYNESEFLNELMAKAEDRAMATFGQGYWGDHWDYYMDLIEAYLGVYPDKEEELMYDKELRYFFSTATVKPRSEKYVLTETFDGKSYHVQQLDATYYDQEKAKEQEAFRNQNLGLLSIEANWQRTAHGQAFMSTPIAKLFLLGAIKFAMRDPYGMGIEYEGGRPGWLDSMNGLPGMVGSGMPETYELLLLLQYVKKTVDTYKRDVVVPEELGVMLETVNSALMTLDESNYEDEEALPQGVPKPLFEYWDVVAAARESYRNDVQYYFSGNTTTLSAETVGDMVDIWMKEVEKGILRAFYFATKGHGDDGTSGIPACFFSYDVTDWKKNKGKTDKGLPLVNALAMKVRVFPLFLEGPVRYMKTIQDDREKMLDMYNRVLGSGLRDTKLGMYFLSASLKGQSYDMGRQIAFAPGWLENQSIWMHMSYKYYLQLIRGKLYDQFFSEMKGGGMLPFMDPDVYGRSLMECSSFIASSAFPDPSIVGEGFLARLSGSTAEFMDMWKLMFMGPNLFSLDDEGKLQFQLVPALPSWFFVSDEDNSKPVEDDDGNPIVSFKMFGAIPVTYHNPGAKDIFGQVPDKYIVVTSDGKEHTYESAFIPEDMASRIRRVTSVKTIDAYYMNDEDDVNQS